MKKSKRALCNRCNKNRVLTNITFKHGQELKTRPVCHECALFLTTNDKEATERLLNSDNTGGVPVNRIPRRINACMECDKDLAEGQEIKLCGDCAKKVSASVRNAMHGKVAPEDLASCMKATTMCRRPGRA